jgi:hypothetical protein
MERVAFIVDETGERIDCLLNPETFEVRRLAGVRPQGSASGHLVGTGRADDPLLFTGGGRTELVLDLVFDVDLIESRARPADVRVATRRLWALAENGATEHGSARPPLVRLVWGKTWNLPGIIAAIAERFDAFGSTGLPRRSWLRLKLVRVADPARPAAADELETAQSAPALPLAAAVQAVGEGETGPGYSGVRFDLLADEALGSPVHWRKLAEHNRVDNPFEVPAGAVLAVPGAAGQGAGS